MNKTYLRTAFVGIAFLATALLVQSQNQEIRRGGGSGSGVTVAAGTNVVIQTNGSVVTVNAVATGATNTFDANQFTLIQGTNVHIKSSALVTGLVSSASVTLTNAASPDHAIVLQSLYSSGAYSIIPNANTNTTELIVHTNSIYPSGVTTAGYNLGNSADGTERFNSAYLTNTFTAHAEVTNAVFYKYGSLSYVDATNVVVGVTNASVYTLLITNNTYLSATNFPPAGWANAFSVELIMDGTGGYTVGFNTNQWKFSSNNIPTISTNANAVSLLSCLTGSGATNVYVSPSLRHR